SAATDLAAGGAPGLARRGRLDWQSARGECRPGPTTTTELPGFSRRVSILQRERRLLENQAPRARILLHFASRLEPRLDPAWPLSGTRLASEVGYARPKPRRNSLPHRAPHRASRGLPSRQAGGHHTLHYREPRPD